MSPLTMDHKLRYDIWTRDEGVCQNCKRKLSRDPYEEIIKELSNLKEIPIFKWSKKCWKCQKETPIVSYDFTVGFSFHLGDVEKLDQILMQKYPFVKRTFSKTRREEVIANTCVHCGSLQGNWFIMEDLINMAYNRDMKLIDLVLSNNLTAEDLHINREDCKPTMTSLGHIHHKDGNPRNNDPSNLILFCRDYHAKIHS
ncbi:HNH endonuclease [Candidatus Bathyarchaeota archaeon]|nr:HNH endonuclease [Candidatus Bathyarchaeota archaeon]